MDCDLETFTREILGKWGFTLGDWIHLQQAYEREREIKKHLDLRDKLKYANEDRTKRGNKAS